MSLERRMGTEQRIKKEQRAKKEHRAKKRFGQNFLVDAAIVSDIATAIHARPQDHLVEIGPGLGALTRQLLASDCQLTAIELDRDLNGRLLSQFGGMDQFSLIEADALKVDYPQLGGNDQPLRVVGNLPYNISTPILFKLLGHIGYVKDMHFMLQKEVVDRLAAVPGTKAYGRLTIMVQTYCDAEPLFDVPGSAFDPVPKVMSSVVRLTPHGHQSRLNDHSILEKITRMAFNNRRKTLRNALSAEIDTQGWHQLRIDPSLRPENLSVDQYIDIANYLAERPKPAI